MGGCCFFTYVSSKTYLIETKDKSKSGSHLADWKGQEEHGEDYQDEEHQETQGEDYEDTQRQDYLDADIVDDIVAKLKKFGFEATDKDIELLEKYEPEVGLQPEDAESASDFLTRLEPVIAELPFIPAEQKQSLQDAEDWESKINVLLSWRS